MLIIIKVNKYSSLLLITTLLMEIHQLKNHLQILENHRNLIILMDKRFSIIILLRCYIVTKRWLINKNLISKLFKNNRILLNKFRRRWSISKINKGLNQLNKESRKSNIFYIKETLIRFLLKIWLIKEHNPLVLR